MGIEVVHGIFITIDISIPIEVDGTALLQVSGFSGSF